jgi:hypothetical protein
MRLEIVRSWLIGRFGAQGEWLADGMARVRAGAGGEPLATLVSRCGQRLGRAAIALAPCDAGCLAQARVPLPPGAWDADELGRVLLLLAAAAGTRPDELPGLVEELFRTGDVRERRALLRCLPHLPGPARFAPLGEEALRNSAVPVLEAMACDNPFPAAHLPDVAFNQMVMKCLSHGLPLGRIMGLAGRINAELQRMVGAAARERRAAGRPVSPDVDLVLGDSCTHRLPPA